MLNIKITPLNATVAGIVAYLFVTVTFPDPETVDPNLRNVIVFSGDVDDKSMRDLAKKMDRAADRADRFVVKITSPGGMVFAGREVTKRFDSYEGVQVDTYADNFFASMGMALFLEGKERMVTEDAIGLIHRGSAGGLSYYTAKLMLEDLRNSPDQSLQKMDRIVALENTIHLMDKLFEPEFRTLEEIKKTAPNPEATQRIIDAMKKGAADLTLNAEEMLEAGIATKIVKPSELRKY